MSSEATTSTLGYYNANASSFCSDTLDVEFSALQDAFARHVPAGGRILDLGCGSGRDTRAFLSRGYQVVAVDGSEELCTIARRVSGADVVHATFEEFEPEGRFDGVWACSSLLHVPKGELVPLIKKYADHLRPGGVFYLSFKYGEFEGWRNGRWFLDLDEDGFARVMEGVSQLCVMELSVTGDVRPGRSGEKWLNAFCRRV